MKVRTNKKQTITKKKFNGVRQYCLHLRAFVSVGEAFFFIFKSSNVHHKKMKWIKKWSVCVLLDLKN